MAKNKAESLDEVLALARVRRQNGMLTIEHTQGGRVEEGELYLQAGQPIYARVGQLVGQDALNWLLQWRNVYFTITTEDPKQPAGTPVSEKSNAAAAFSSPKPQSPSLNGNTSTGLPDVQAQGDGNASRKNTYTPGIEWLIPQKRGVEREVLSLPLTRRQRFIYFLVDGRRTIADLSRCTGKDIQEVELTLSELQEQGLVAILG